jgi:hypothetical protein
MCILGSYRCESDGAFFKVLPRCGEEQQPVTTTMDPSGRKLKTSGACRREMARESGTWRGSFGPEAAARLRPSSVVQGVKRIGCRSRDGGLRCD